MKTLYFDVMSGASGDMILSSLIDIGVPLDYLRAELGKLNIPGFSLDVEKQKRSAIAASHLVLSWDSPKAYRHAAQILDMIKAAQYPARVCERCEKVLMRLGKAEAKVHDIPLEKVHFHEIGAVDTIVDIAGTCCALEYLDVGEIVFSTLTDGRGTVTTAHGVMPVPVPAVAEMAQGFALRILDIETELLTPTGCAILTALGRQQTGGFSGTIIRSGYGCGTRVLDTPGATNVLRVLYADAGAQAAGDSVCVIESDMDHVSGEIMADAASRLMNQGALDVSWTPVFMKKGRPGYRLTVLCTPESREAMADTIMVHLRTLGVRISIVQRIIAERKQADAMLRGEQIEEKQCSYKGHSFAKPEYESLARLSEKTGIPVVELMEEYFQRKK